MNDEFGDLDQEPGRSRFGAAAARLKDSRFVRDVGSLWSASALVTLVAAIQGIIVAKVLHPSGYGTAGLIASVPVLVFVFFDARSADAAMRYLGEFAAQGREAEARAFCRVGYGLDLGVGLVSLALSAVIAPWAASHIVHDPAAGWLVVVFAAGMFLRTPAVTSEATLITLGRARAVGTLQVGAMLMRAVLVLGALALGAGVAGVIWGTAIGFALEGAAYLTVTSRAIHHAWGGGWVRASLSPLSDRRREITRFILWADLGSTVGLASKQSDTFFVGFFLNPAAAGYYRLAVSLGSLGGVVVGPLQSVLYQRFAQLRGRGDRAGLFATVRKAALHLCAPSAALGLLALPLVPWMIRVTAGSAYLPAVTPTRILVLASIVWLAFAWVRPFVLTMGEVKLWTALGVLGAAVALVGYVLVTRRWGIAGTAWVRFASLMVAPVIGGITLWRRSRMSGTPEPGR